MGNIIAIQLYSNQSHPIIDIVINKCRDQFFQGDFLSGVMSKFFKIPRDLGVLLRLLIAFERLLIFFAEIDRDFDLSFSFSL